MFGWDDLILGGMSLFGSLFGSHQQSKANDEAAKIQADAAKYAADLQAKSLADALGFQKSQAENAYLNSQAASQGNYNQWAARERRLSTLGQLLGLGPRDIPAFVPGVDPHFDGRGAPAAAAPAATGPMPAVSANNGDIGQQVSAYFKSRGVSDAETPYWVQKWAEFGAKDPAYFNQRLAAADIFGGGQAPTAAPASLARMLQPASFLAASGVPGLTVPITPTLTMPRPLSAYLS